jgi:hypothetical protein
MTSIESVFTYKMLKNYYYSIGMESGGNVAVTETSSSSSGFPVFPGMNDLKMTSVTMERYQLEISIDV